MASCDDDFAILEDDAQSHQHHHHHHHHDPAAATFSVVAGPHRFASKPVLQIRPQSHLSAAAAGDPNHGDDDGGGDDEDDDDYGHDFTPAAHSDASKGRNAAYHIVGHRHCFAEDDAGGDNPFGPQPADGDHNDDDDANPDRKSPLQQQHLHHRQQGDKSKERDELSDGGSPYCLTHGSGGKKPRPSACPATPVFATAAVVATQSSSGEYRKDREEWSDSAIGCLLDAYTDKYALLNRGNLRGRDWEDVASIVSQRCDKQKSGKSVEQCKNKIDNLKKRYKAECQRLSSGNLSISHWPWFKKLEQIVSASSKTPTDDDKSAVALGGSSSGATKQTKRYSFYAQGPSGVSNNLKMKALSNLRWKRVVLKISGSILAGSGPHNVDPKISMLIAREIEMANHAGVEVAVVVGGRNFFCDDSWVSATGIDRATAYQIGMMASVMNGILLQASLEKVGVQTRVLTGFTMQELAEPYIRRRAIRHLEKRRVVIFGGICAGTGSPLFTTDTAAALRASEINADVIIKGTNGDTGAYACHSQSGADISFEHISFRELVSRGFAAMDMNAITFCEENNIPVVFFNMLEPGNISRVICGDQIGTLVDQSGRVS